MDRIEECIRRTPSARRLLDLPDFFSVDRLRVSFQWPAYKVHIYVKRWADLGYLQSPAHRSGYYFNLLKNPNAEKACAAEAMRALHPVAVVVGLGALWVHGVIDMPPMSRVLAIPQGVSIPVVPGFSFAVRDSSWFEIAQSLWSTIVVEGFPVVQPELALADLLAAPGEWRPTTNGIRTRSLDWALARRLVNSLGVDVPDAYRFLRTAPGSIADLLEL